MHSAKRPIRLLSLPMLSAAGKRLALVPAALLLAACATTTTSTTEPGAASRPAEQVARPAVPAAPTPEELTLKSLVALQDRLYRVAAPLIISNPELCKADRKSVV